MYKGYSYKDSTSPAQSRARNCSLFLILGDESLSIKRSCGGSAMGRDSPLAALSLNVGRHQPTTSEQTACGSVCMRQEELQPKIMRFGKPYTS